jgi:archaetidylinositol phosphate synthase
LSSSPSALQRSRKRRQGTELLCEHLFRPLAHLVVLALLPLRVPPPAVVLAGAAAGLGGAVELARGHLVVAALLIQLKTVLDNADGQLARLSSRVTAVGRYLDSECDLLVDAALFASLGWYAGTPGAALAGFLVLTAVLSLNFNLERLARGGSAASGDLSGLAARLARVYALLYGWQDVLVERFVERRLRGASEAARRAYHDPMTVTALANLGMSTQLAAFGLCAALGHPLAFVWLLLGETVLLALLLARRELSIEPNREVSLEHR